MNRNLWIKVPLWWVRNGVGLDPKAREDFGIKEAGLRSFTQHDRGNSIAALKLYIGLLVKTNNMSSDPEYGKSTWSITEIQKSTGLSREKIVTAGRILEEYRLIDIDRKNGAKNIYKIVGYEINSWGKIPKGMFRLITGGDTLKQITTRSKAGLNALKLYIYLVSCYDSKFGYSQPGYYTIENKTGIIRNEIKRALSMLINLELIVIEHEIPDSKSGNPYNTPNRYYIRGLSGKY